MHHTRRAATLVALALCIPADALGTQAIYDTTCGNGGCHFPSPPFGAMYNAANASAVIVQANTTHGMGFSAGFMTANAGSLATYIGTLITASQTINVNYNATVGFTVDNIVLNHAGGGIITTINQVSAPARGNMLGSGTASPSYQHTATNCTSDSFQVRGQGLQNTSNRTINVTVNAPSAPIATNGSTTLTYSTSPQTIDLAAIGAISGTSPSGGMGLGTPSPNVGSVVATGPATLTYTANAVTYAPIVTVAYNVAGPCGTSSATRTVTLNVNAPPAPVVANVGPITVPFGAATPVDLTASIAGVVASNPAGTYNLVASQPTAAGSGSTSVVGNVVTYSPGTFSGTTTFTYTKSGPGGVSNVGTVTLNVTPQAPVTGAGTATVAFNTPTVINLAPFISGGTATSVTPSSPVNGTVVATGPTSVTFTPTAGYAGPASFTYTATNAGGTSAPATVTITVSGQLPIAGPGTATVPFNTPTVINLAGFITGGAATSVTPSGAVNGGVVASGPTSVTFTPTTGYSGSASFTYTATNANGTSGSATISITVLSAVTFSGPSATGTGTITATFFGGGASCAFSSPRFIAAPPGAPPVPPEAPPGNVSFPHGLFDFSATGCATGSTLTFTIVYPSAITNTIYWKYGPTPGNAAPHWYVLPATISGNIATFTIIDGALGDDDLTANGTIVDQGGPGIGGPIQTPTFSTWVLGLLGLLMAWLGRRRLRGA